MGGKAILFLIIGFSVIFLVASKNINKYSVRAVENVVDYHSEVVAHNIAVSAANIGANKIFIDPTWISGLHNVSFQGGEYSVDIQILDAFRNIRKIVSTGTYNGITDTVEVILQPSKFSKFAYYSTTEPNGIYWATGDTVYGPFHTQDYIHVSGTPVFNGKVTTRMGISRQHNGWKGSSDNPEFNGGYEEGVNLPLPSSGVSDLEAFADADGYKFTGEDSVYLTFAGDSIRYKFSYSGPETTVLGKSFAPNGVIFAQDAVLRVKGIVKGQYTVTVSGSHSKNNGNAWGWGHGNGWGQSGVDKGDIFIDDDIKYNTNPDVDPNSTDILGLVAKNDVYITDNQANNHNVVIQASIYCETGGFGAENYDSRPNSGMIYLLGGIIQDTRLAVGTFSNRGTSTGFNKSYRYDERFLFSSPPNYPNTGSFEIVSWYE